jgi:hypothetical protein
LNYNRQRELRRWIRWGELIETPILFFLLFLFCFILFSCPFTSTESPMTYDLLLLSYKEMPTSK